MSEKQELRYKGVGVSPGIAHGSVVIFDPIDPEIGAHLVGIDHIGSEIKRLEEALVQTRTQINAIKVEIEHKLGPDEAQIFDAHLMVLEDRDLINQVIQKFRETQVNIGHCLKTVYQEYVDKFSKLHDPSAREKVSDIQDVFRRLINNLIGQDPVRSEQSQADNILVARDISPSESAQFEDQRVLGIVTSFGGRTSHAVIMARSLQVPAVVGIPDILEKLQAQDYVIVDGDEGMVVVNPLPETIASYERIKKARQVVRQIFESTLNLSARTLDGSTIELMANIEGVGDLETVEKNAAGGIGLFRTESLYMRRENFPSEEEQFQIYKSIAQDLTPNPVVIRTLDLGGDKMPASFYYKERNPFMGLRGIRFCLRHPDLFRAQIRAILRASTFGSVRMLLPMISSVEQLEAVRREIEQAQVELEAKGQAFNEAIQVGIMIEVPCAIDIMQPLADHCDFFSIGTNDLIQYLIAVDRVNERVSDLYDAYHPSVLRSLERIVTSAAKTNTPVSVCGEMASDPLAVPFLVGLGIQSLSMTPSRLPEIKYLLRQLSLEDTRGLAQRVLRLHYARETYEQLWSFYKAHMEDLATIDLAPKPEEG